jgi:hypothetical protein
MAAEEFRHADVAPSIHYFPGPHAAAGNHGLSLTSDLGQTSLNRNIPPAGGERSLRPASIMHDEVLITGPEYAWTPRVFLGGCCQQRVVQASYPWRTRMFITRASALRAGKLAVNATTQHLSDVASGKRKHLPVNLNSSPSLLKEFRMLAPLGPTGTARVHTRRGRSSLSSACAWSLRLGACSMPILLRGRH